jgi:sortase A
LILILLAIPVRESLGQSLRGAACRCQPDGKPRKPRFLLPVAGGIGFLPVLAARDSQLPSIALPALVDIRDTSPRNALEGERALEVGALAPDTATALPTVMLIAVILVCLGACFMMPRRRRRRVWAKIRSRGGPRGGWRLRSLPRRRIGVALTATGGVLLLLGARDYVEGAEVQRRARAEWLRVGESAVQVNAPDASATPPREVTTVAVGTATSDKPSRAVPLPRVVVSGREIRRGAPIARLVIPDIDVDEIVMEGVGPVELNGGPGHFPGSVLPGNPGNSILSAHRDRHFRRVGELSVGSRIRTETRERSVEWVVTERRVVSKDTPALFREPDATLTLTTCWPIRYFGAAPDRLLIIAKPVR